MVHMKPKITLTKAEHEELQRLLNIVKNKNNLPGERRLARAQFDNLYNKALKRNQSNNRGLMVSGSV